jgi:uncharacterized membrane protein YoaK (UPF0700 family)
MSTLFSPSNAPRTSSGSSDGIPALSQLEARLPPLLSVIAGMVDLTGFFTLGHVFTAHVTGNLVVAAAVVVQGGPVVPAQLLAIPVFMLALAAVWLLAEMSHRDGPRLARRLLLVQFGLLAIVLIFSVIAKPSSSPHGVAAGIAVMLCVSAMACQYALLRLAMPTVVSTAVMTGNLTNAVLSLMELAATRHPLLRGDAERLRQSLYLLAGFLLGCVVAAAAVSLLADWAWALPAVLAAAALALR